MADRVKLAIPGIAIGLAIMMTVSVMQIMYGTNIYCALGTMFTILVYPYILKRYLERTA